MGVARTEEPGNATTPNRNSGAVIVVDIRTRKRVVMNRSAQWTETGGLGPFTLSALGPAAGDENEGPGNVTTPDPGTEERSARDGQLWSNCVDLECVLRKIQLNFIEGNWQKEEGCDPLKEHMYVGQIVWRTLLMGIGGIGQLSLHAQKHAVVE